MRTLTVCFMLAAFNFAVQAKRVKRSTLLQFGMMIKCATGRSALFDYNGYGCWCGHGGSGTPVDSTDRCCREHDQCYHRLVVSKTCRRNAWFWPWRAWYNRVGCTGCSSLNRGCGRYLCFCDQQAVACFQKAHFNYANKYYYRGYC